MKLYLTVVVDPATKPTLTTNHKESCGLPNLTLYSDSIHILELDGDLTINHKSWNFGKSFFIILGNLLAGVCIKYNFNKQIIIL